MAKETLSGNTSAWSTAATSAGGAPVYSDIMGFKNSIDQYRLDQEQGNPYAKELYLSNIADNNFDTAGNVLMSIPFPVTMIIGAALKGMQAGARALGKVKDDVNISQSVAQTGEFGGTTDNSYSVQSGKNRYNQQGMGKLFNVDNFKNAAGTAGNFFAGMPIFGWNANKNNWKNRIADANRAMENAKRIVNEGSLVRSGLSALGSQLETGNRISYMGGLKPVAVGRSGLIVSKEDKEMFARISASVNKELEERRKAKDGLNFDSCDLNDLNDGHTEEKKKSHTGEKTSLPLPLPTERLNGGSHTERKTLRLKELTAYALLTGTTGTAETAGTAASYKDGGSIIVEGVTHDEKHGIQLENITKEGVPVIALPDGGKVDQQAEVEKDELTLSWKVSQKLLELMEDGCDKQANRILAGKILARELMLNTRDSSSGLLKKV
jgi:hypothetical protein